MTEEWDNISENDAKKEAFEQHLHGCYLFPINLTNDLSGERATVPISRHPQRRSVAAGSITPVPLK